MSTRKPIGDKAARQFFESLEVGEASEGCSREDAATRPVAVREVGRSLGVYWKIILPVGVAPITILMFLSPLPSALSLAGVVWGAIALRLACWRYNASGGSLRRVPTPGFLDATGMLLFVLGLQMWLEILIVQYMRFGAETRAQGGSEDMVTFAGVFRFLALLAHFPIMTVVLAVLLPTSADKAFKLTMLHALISVSLVVAIVMIGILLLMVF